MKTYLGNKYQNSSDNFNVQFSAELKGEEIVNKPPFEVYPPPPSVLTLKSLSSSCRSDFVQQVAAFLRDLICKDPPVPNFDIYFDVY